MIRHRQRPFKPSLGSDRAAHWASMHAAATGSNATKYDDVTEGRLMQWQIARAGSGHDASVIARDVHRALHQFGGLAGRRRAAILPRLEALLEIFFERNSRLHYFQGFHDVASVVLLATESPREALLVLDRIATTHQGDVMGAEGMAVAGEAAAFVAALVSEADAPLGSHLAAFAFPPHYMLSWLLTFCTHDLPTLEDGARVLDFVLARPPPAIQYLCAAVSAACLSPSPPIPFHRS